VGQTKTVGHEVAEGHDVADSARAISSLFFFPFEFPGTRRMSSTAKAPPCPQVFPLDSP
jgi:hypothetical protein